jgi:uncharacterized protein (DUF58 family)
VSGWNSLSPGSRLLWAVVGWVFVAAASVVFPLLDGVVVAAGWALAVAVLVDAGWLLSATPLALVRRAPERLAIGSQAVIEIDVENRGRRRVFVELVDEVPRDLVARDPRFDEVVLAAGETQVLRYRVVPQLRGDRGFGPMAALCRSRLALLRRRVLAGQGQSVRVYPDTRRFLVPEALSPKKLLASLGVKPTRPRGEGSDFESLRDYVPGDDTRRIDWRATARRGRLVTRLHQHERNHTLMIAVDASRLMGGWLGSRERTKLDAAIDAALVLAWSALHAGDRAGLVVFDRERRAFLEPRARRAQLGAFVELLAPVDSRLVEADYGVLARTLLRRRQRRSLVVILSDFAESDVGALVTPLALLARRHRVLLVALRDPRFESLDPRRRSRASAASRGGLYQQIVLDDLLVEREETLARLRRQGVQTLDLVSEEITGLVLNRYLEMRYSHS